MLRLSVFTEVTPDTSPKGFRLRMSYAGHDAGQASFAQSIAGKTSEILIEDVVAKRSS